MAAEPSNAENSAPLEATASAWLARHDRGLTAAEQDGYFEWLRADPRHGAMIAHLEKTWGALDALGGGSLFHPNALDLRQGTIRATGNPLDVAIRGAGWFAVEAPVTMLRVYCTWPGVSAMMNLRRGVAK